MVKDTDRRARSSRGRLTSIGAVSGATWNSAGDPTDQRHQPTCRAERWVHPDQAVSTSRRDKTPVDQDWLGTFLMYARPVIKALVMVMFGTRAGSCEAHRLGG